MDRFARIEQHRVVRQAEPVRAGRYAVYRVHDNGRREKVKFGLDYVGADVLAGRLRDLMTDDECARGYNYLPLKESAT